MASGPQSPTSHDTGLIDPRSAASSYVRLSMPWSALLVAGACYLGALAGARLEFPGGGAAVLFPPYAVLGTALCLARPQRMIIYLLASTLGNFLGHATGGEAATFALTIETANWARALAAALALRACGWNATRLNDMRGMALFLIFAAGVGPAVGAFVGAFMVVRAGGSSDYLLTWEQWFLSNALTALTLLPLLLTIFHDLHTKRAVPSAARVFEALVLGTGLLLAGAGAFAFSSPDMTALPLRVYWPLPFLLWGAARFAPPFTSGSLLIVTGLTIWGAFRGIGPFIVDAPAPNLLRLQLFVLALALPLLLLAALVQQARRTAKELRASEARYRSIVEDQTELICRLLPDGTFTFVNDAYAAFYGRPKDAFVGKTMRDVLPVEARIAAEVRLAAVTHDTNVITKDGAATDGTGTQRFLQWRDRGFFDDQGAILEYQSVGRDITDRRRAEDERRRLEAQTEIAATLREADRRKDEFLAMLGHELRNPLAPVGLALETLKEHAPMDAQASRAHAIIARQLGHMTRLVDDLLDVSRITRGAIELRLETVDLREGVTQGIETARPSIERRRHELIVNLPAEPLWVRGDATRLAQMVGNLLHNAAKYTEPGGRIHVTAARSDDRATVAVRDSGIGISADMLSRIFELFAQAETRGNTVRGGLGIGLTLVQRLADLHGGTVEVRSAGPQRGSEFVLNLPALDAEPARDERPVPGAESTAHHLRILVVDDNIDAAEALARVLERWGHETRSVHDGADAVEAAATFAPDVVLLDLDLPTLDGYEVARRLRQIESSERRLLVALTGFGQQNHIERAREAGFDHHFVKPIDVGVLRGLLQRAGA